jgi:hypothetical protein
LVSEISAQLKPVVSIQDSAHAEIQTNIRCFGWTDILFFGFRTGATDTQPVSAEPFYTPKYVVLGWILAQQILKPMDCVLVRCWLDQNLSKYIDFW